MAINMFYRYVLGRTMYIVYLPDKRNYSTILSPLKLKYFLSLSGVLNAFSHPKLNITYKSQQDIHDNVMALEVLFTSMVTSEIKQVSSADVMKFPDK